MMVKLPCSKLLVPFALLIALVSFTFVGHQDTRADDEVVRLVKVDVAAVDRIETIRSFDSSGWVVYGGVNGEGILAVKNVFSDEDVTLYKVEGVDGFTFGTVVNDSVIMADRFGPRRISVLRSPESPPITVDNTFWREALLTHEVSATALSQENVSKAYVPSVFENLVYIVDLDILAVTGVVPVGINPFDAQISDATGLAYVANFSANTVSVIDTTTDTVISVVPVGAGPVQVAVRPTAGLVYVTNMNDNTVSVIDEASGTVIATIPVGDGPFGVSVNQITGSVYVANQIADSVSVIDGETNTMVATVRVGDFPIALAVISSAGLISVANFNDRTISVLAHTPAAALWTDVNCNGVANSIDAFLLLSHVASFPVTQGESCPDIGTNIAVAEGDDVTVRLFGDADCDGDVDAIDALKKLREVAGLSVSQTEPCPDIGSPVQIP